MDTEVSQETHRTGVAETARIFATILLPSVARGVLLRRPLTKGMLVSMGADQRAVTTLRTLRERHGDDPLPVRVLGRRAALVLSPQDVERILKETPEPFSSQNLEKKSALSHFQPHGVLISDHDERPRRRAANDLALEPDLPVHPDGATMAAQAEEEAQTLVTALGPHGELDWLKFSDSFNAVARRVVFGAFAAYDRRTTELLRDLRARGNWSYLAPVQRAARAEFLGRVRANIARAEPGSLAAALAAGGGPDTDVRPQDQIGHWLFAFDAAAIATYRALALLTSRSPRAREAREEARTREGIDLPLVRATVQESVRLWPTTLVILRESTRETQWRSRKIGAGTAFVIMSHYFHRDSTQLPYADDFVPEIWLDGSAAQDPGLVPFSYGPAGCAGGQVVPLVASLFLAGLLRRCDLTSVGAGVPLPEQGLPSMLNHFALRFSVSPSTTRG